MSRRGGLPRPSRAAGPILSSVLGLGALAAVARNSGSGWVQALGCLVAGFVVVGLLGPALAAATLSVEVIAAPPDATAGRTTFVDVRTSAPVRVVPLRPPGPPATIGAGTGRIALVAERRGPLAVLSVTVGSAAPFGLLWWHKRVELALPQPIWVAPAPGTPEPGMLASSEGGALELGRRRDAPSGEFRGVRPYVAGDPQSSVHWASTAHHGRLMVREMDDPDTATPSLEVVLPDDGPAGDAAAAAALATLLGLLAHGGSVLVSTTERDGVRTESVSGALEAGRRLARAVSPRHGTR